MSTSRPVTSHELRVRWWVPMLVGVLAIVAGIIVLLRPGDSLSAITVVVGIFVLIDGVAALVEAIRGDTANRGMLTVLGAISVIAGVILVRHPFSTVTVFAVLLGVWLIAAGTVRLVAALSVSTERWWRAADAAISIIFGIVLVASPHIGIVALAWIAGIGLIVYGLVIVGLGALLGSLQRTLRGVAAADASASTATRTSTSTGRGASTPDRH